MKRAILFVALALGALLCIGETFSVKVCGGLWQTTNCLSYSNCSPDCVQIDYVQDGKTNQFHAWLTSVEVKSNSGSEWTRIASNRLDQATAKLIEDLAPITVAKDLVDSPTIEIRWSGEAHYVTNTVTTDNSGGCKECTTVFWSRDSVYGVMPTVFVHSSGQICPGPPSEATWKTNTTTVTRLDVLNFTWREADHSVTNRTLIITTKQIFRLQSQWREVLNR